MDNSVTIFQDPAPTAAVGMVMIFLVFGLISLAFSILFAVVYCKICSRTGYHWALGLLMFVPIANIVLPFILAFSEWPIQKELDDLKRKTGGSY